MLTGSFQGLHMGPCLGIKVTSTVTVTDYLKECQKSHNAIVDQKKNISLQHVHCPVSFLHFYSSDGLCQCYKTLILSIQLLLPYILLSLISCILC